MQTKSNKKIGIRTIKKHDFRSWQCEGSSSTLSLGTIVSAQGEILPVHNICNIFKIDIFQPFQLEDNNFAICLPGSDQKSSNDESL